MASEVAAANFSPEPQFDDAEQQRSASNFGIWVFLATEVLFFGALFASYTITRVRYSEAFAAGSRLTDVVLGGINTGLLITSSLTMALAIVCARRGLRRPLLGWLGLTIALGVAFLVVKGFEYHGDYVKHLVPTIDFQYSGMHAEQVELFFFLYFFITLVHALHLLIGIACVGVLAWMAARGAFSEIYNTPVEVVGLYWHLVDIVWLFVFPLLYLISRP